MSRFNHGDTETVREQFDRELSLGVDGFTINLPANGHVPERVSLLGTTLAPLIGRNGV